MLYEKFWVSAFKQKTIIHVQYREDKMTKLKKLLKTKYIFHHIDAILQNISIMKDDCDLYLFFFQQLV